MGNIEGETMDVLRKINKMRLDRERSIYRLSLESGISQSTLTNMFNRETLPSITTLECICNAFCITMSEFFREDSGVNANNELLSLYNSLDENLKTSVLTIIKHLKND